MHTSDGSSISTSWSRSFQVTSLPHLGTIWPTVVAHVAGLDPYDMHDLAWSSTVSWIGSVLRRSCTTYHNGRWGTRWSRSRSVRDVNYVELGWDINTQDNTPTPSRDEFPIRLSPQRGGTIPTIRPWKGLEEIVSEATSSFVVVYPPF